MTENNQPLTIAVTELIKEASRIKEFRGDKSYDLSAFIREVELILPLFNENRPLQEFVFQRYIRTKIQGAALNAIRTLGQSPSWTTIREELIRNFGIKETYHNLYHQAISTKNNNVSDYYHNLRNILDKLNTKYDQDNNKPVEFSPGVNESIILKTFLNGIDPNLASIVYSRNKNSLRDAYYLLEETGMLRKYDNKFSKSNRFTPRPNGSTQPSPQQGPLQNTSSSDPSSQSKQTKANSGQFNRNSQQTRRFQNNTSRNSGQYRAEPMEIDNIEATHEEGENFRSPADTITYR